MYKISRAFYKRDALCVARELLGKYLIHNSPNGLTIGQISETEAYIGPFDRASHAYRGLHTKRTDVQFGPGGYAYVYQIYGIYYCFNVVVSLIDKPEVVLIRAVKPVEGVDIMAKRRGFLNSLPKNIDELTNGPGKLCLAMGITKEHNGEDLCGDKIFLTDTGTKLPQESVCQTPRINIDYAGLASEYPWRFVIKEQHHKQ